MQELGGTLKGTDKVNPIRKETLTVLKKILSGAALAAIAAASFAAPSFAVNSQGGAASVVLNPGGSRLANGSDGIVIVINGYSGGAAVAVDDGNPETSDMTVPATGSDQVYFAQVPQWCCSGVSPILNIGGIAYGEAQAAGDGGSAVSWDSVTVVDSTGAKELIANGSDAAISSTATGNATADIRYSVTVSGRTYTVDREITYTYPNTYYDEVWTVTIPNTNTAEVGPVVLEIPPADEGSITGTVMDELERSGGRYGLITLCIGGGMGIATIIERV